MTTGSNTMLRKLSDSDEKIDDAANDIRGRGVKDKNGDTIGTVQDLLIDDTEHKVRFLVVEHGGFLGFGETRSFIPVDAITRVTPQDVYIDHTSEHIAAAPTYDPDLADDRAYRVATYDHYGYVPYWGARYIYPFLM